MKKYYFTRTLTVGNNPDLVYYVTSNAGECYCFTECNFKDIFVDRRKQALRALKDFLSVNYPEDFV